MGYNALGLSTTGSENIAIGEGAGYWLETGDNNIYVGNDASLANDSESNVIRIGNNTHTNALIAGVSVVSPSSERFKEDIQDIEELSSNLMRLRPVSFRYKKQYDGGDSRRRYGLIAEEVAEVYPELVVNDNSGKVRTVLYQNLNALLLNELQKQQRQIRELTERLARVELSHVRLGN